MLGQRLGAAELLEAVPAPPPRLPPAARQALQKAAADAGAQATAALQTEIDHLQLDLKMADGKLAEMQHASVARWKDHQAGLSEAVDRLHSGPDSASTVPG